MRRASATPVAPTQISPRSPPTKKAKTSEPRESSKAPRDSQSQPPPTRRPIASSPIEGNSDCRSRAFHVEAYFDHSILRQQPELRIHTAYLRDCRGFPYPYAPADPAAFKRWAPLSEWDMVRILSRETSSQRILMRKELLPGMLLVDVVLRANLFPLQHRVQRQGAILEALFRISEGYYFGPHHLIMATLLHFEEKVHTRSLMRADTILLLFPRCYAMFWRIWVSLQTLILSPAAIVKRVSLLTNGIRYGSISIPQNFPRQGKSLHSLYQRQHHLTPHLLFLLPQSRPLLSLLRQDQQTLILREIQQHLGFLPPAPPVSPVPSEPFASADDFDPTDDATPGAVPSTVAAEDPSYPPEEPTT
ncbi:hypothetical protein CK203_116650 [Vitis vinifera]|uniref:Uncharacterized protein n=1 Tax=Vitis vinifera TaxID=29760 RepID=A0A438C8S9_VITVI|nr:hypothetical protein CK203_116650 [Vitis vinifera]